MRPLTLPGGAGVIIYDVYSPVLTKLIPPDCGGPAIMPGGAKAPGQQACIVSLPLQRPSEASGRPFNNTSVFYGKTGSIVQKPSAFGG